jgi:HAE1 family hydrophobic/amphiphilic exporter-1
MMTTCATLLTGVPLAIGTGIGSELRQPLGYAMVGEFALSHLFALYTTPVVYLYLDRLQAWLRASRREPRREPEEKVAAIAAE